MFKFAAITLECRNSTKKTCAFLSMTIDADR